MQKNVKEMDGSFEEIEIPLDLTERIKRVIRSEKSVYRTVEKFVEDAVEMKLTGLTATDVELEERIVSALVKMKNKKHIDSILEQILCEIWGSDKSDYEWTPEPMIMIDGNLVLNPEYIKAFQWQKDIIWSRMIDRQQLKRLK